MQQILLRTALFAAVIGFPVLGTAQERNTQRPNVVLIMTDDVGYGDIGSYGAPDVRTPHIDSLARDGVRLTDFYANGATCTPTLRGSSPDGISNASHWSGLSALRARLIGSGDYLPRGGRCHNS